MTSNPARIGILIASDRASSGQYQDASGPAIEAYLADVLESRWQCDYRLVPDEQTVIADTLVDLVDHSACDLILMSGGTGPAARDVTPEAMASICDRLLPGFGEEMRRASLRDVPTAILSRQEAGLRGRCLIIALPGKPAAIRTCLDAVFPAVPYCLDLTGAARLETRSERLKAFRPSAKV